MISQKQLKERLRYDPETGDFAWLVSETNRINVGDVAGYEDKGSLSITVMGEKYLSRRLAFLYMTGELPTGRVKNINGIRKDNRWVNLKASSKPVAGLRRKESLKANKLQSVINRAFG